MQLLVRWSNCIGLYFPYRVSALFWIFFRKPQEKYLNYFQEILKQLNCLPVEEVGLYVYMVRGGLLTALALWYSSEIKICETVCILLSVKISNFCITFQAPENLTVHVIGGNVVWKLCSWKIAAVSNIELLAPWDVMRVSTAYRIQKMLFLYRMKTSDILFLYYFLAFQRQY